MKALFSLALSSVILLTSTSFADGERGDNKTSTAQSEKKSSKRTVKRYPFDFCLVSNDKLGELGKPIAFAYKGREIKVCCRDCKNDFDKTPEQYMQRLEKLLSEKEKNLRKSEG